MITDRVSFLIFVKYPIAGRVKTRLAASIGDRAAALLYRDFVQIFIQKISRINQVDCTIYFDPPEEEVAVRRWLGDRYSYLPQPPGDLGDRLRWGFNRQLKYYTRVIAFGSDSPDLPMEYIQNACDALHTHPLAIGPTDDGGYYLIGLNQLYPELFQDIPWSTPDVFDKTIAFAQSISLSPIILPRWYDVDVLADFNRLLASNDTIIQEYATRWEKYVYHFSVTRNL